MTSAYTPVTETETAPQKFNAAATTVMDWCDKLAAISAEEGKISRFYLTPEQKLCNETVARWMQLAGMTTHVDAAANLIGHFPARNPDAPHKTLILASHLDSIPNAGAYDGILGVLTAIAAVQKIYDREVFEGIARPEFAIDIIGFGDEEGTRFGSTLLGSRAVAGTWNPAWWQLCDSAGVSLKDAFTHYGLEAAAIASASYADKELLGYLELHIEQGPVLEDNDLALGIVTSIAGARRFIFNLQGYAGHAGTVPMNMRKDALVGAAKIICEIEAIAKREGVVATVGKIQAFPGGVNVIAGGCEFTLDIRSGDDALRDASVQKILAATGEITAQSQLDYSYREIHTAPAVGCAPWIQAVQAQVLGDMQLPDFRLMSGAGHDAMAMADICDVAMYFVRCKGGVSHHPDESVLVEDVALGIEALYRTLLAL